MSAYTLTSLRSAIKSKLHIDSPYVDAAIAEALRFFRSEPMWFNMKEYTFETLADEYSYSLPDDFLSVRGNVYVTPSGSESDQTRYRLKPGSAEEIETYRYGLSEWDSPPSDTPPRLWGMDHGGKKMLVCPVSSNGGDEIFFKYTYDCSTPEYTVSITSASAPALGNTTTLVNSAGTSIPTTYVSPWIDNAFDLILNRAMFYLLVDYHNKPDNMQKAELFRLRSEDELRRLKGETSISQSPLRLRHYW